jgi:hypothetical protein
MHFVSDSIEYLCRHILNRLKSGPLNILWHLYLHEILNVLLIGLLLLL